MARFRFGSTTCAHCGQTQAAPVTLRRIGDERRAGALVRIGALLLGLILLFLAAIATYAMARITGNPPREDRLLRLRACFDGSGGGKLLSLMTGWPATLLLGVSCVRAFGFVLRSRNGGRVGVLTSIALLLLLFNAVVTRALTG